MMTELEQATAFDNRQSHRWRTALALWLLAWGAVFYQPLLGAASVWAINDTFNHCFLVLPASLFALWKQRGAIFAQPPRFSAMGLLAVAGVLVILALGQAAYIDVFQHVAVFGLLPAMALLLFGWKVVLSVWFPLVFILFSVPVGEELMPQFQNITADIAITILQWINVPVYRDGLYITVPNGNFVVAEACSGVRFFIACVVLGTAFAYLNFVSRWRALLFTAFSIILPIVANGIRAFGIIYVGHMTNMEHAAGADHLVYGWFFFALVVVVLLVVGHYFSDGHRPWQDQVIRMSPAWQNHWRPVTAAIAILPLGLALGLNLVLTRHETTPFQLPAGELFSITADSANSRDWTPRIEDADEYWTGRDNTTGALLYQAVFHYNSPGNEMVSWANRVYDIDSWSIKDQTQLLIPGLGAIDVLDLTSLRNHRRLLAYWYEVPGQISSSQARTKLQQAVNKLLLRPSGGALVAASLEYRGDRERALTKLQQTLSKQVYKLTNLPPASGD